MTQDPSSAANLRVGHAERDAVSAVLQEAAADGRLEMDELDERLDAALLARTYADLEPLVADLSVDLPWRSYPRAMAVALPPQGPPQPGYSREDPLRFDGGMSSEKRDGAWTVPPFLRISSGAGSVKLNCLRASAAGRVIDVEVIAGVGSVLMILPDGWAANDDRLGKSIGRKTNKVPHTPASGTAAAGPPWQRRHRVVQGAATNPSGAAQARSCGTRLIGAGALAGFAPRQRAVRPPLRCVTAAVGRGTGGQRARARLLRRLCSSSMWPRCSSRAAGTSPNLPR